MKPHFRRDDLARRYGVTVRTIGNMIDDHRLSPPDFYNGRFPMWTDETVQADERALAARGAPPSRMISRPADSDGAA